MQQLREYQIIEKLGEGGMGVVYKALDPNLERNVAVKAIHSTFTSNSELVARFKQEARVQASLTHPNIVSLYNFFVENDIYYMVMEYVDGETLTNRLKRVGLIPPHKCIPIFKQMLQAVDYAHRNGIIHRDIKPSNILLDKNDNVKVMDFGIAKLVGEKGLTKTGTKLGTLYYMSPEQVMGEKNIDGRSDIFSLGITFFEMLTGQLPYSTDTDSDFKLMQQIVENKLPTVKKYYPYVPDKVDEAIEIATKKNRHERFKTCEEFIDFIKYEVIEEQESASKRRMTIAPVENKIKIQPLNPSIPNNINNIKESLSGSFAKASVLKRIGAILMDCFFIIVALVIARLIAQSIPGTKDKIILVIFALTIFSPAIIMTFFRDGLRKGKGIAKGMLGLRIIDEKNRSLISKGKGFIRELLIVISYVLTILFTLTEPYVGPIVLLIVELVTVSKSTKGKRLVDMILGTQVVNENAIKIEGDSVTPVEKIYK